ncbi:receptor serine/threonine kinase, putative [Ricinus communis]|uniref:non-specific serine/threonine protein kinase n=1 Tax=Ricinus communis TaxID=3988 RepID=B9RIJ9_RICCO|nr:receptor serine/threonine kinase, putative [Ricinus communis]
MQRLQQRKLSDLEQGAVIMVRLSDFPFGLKVSSQAIVGFPGFDLSCTENHHTLLELPISVKMYVKDIDYRSQTINVYDPDMCLSMHLKNLNLSTSSFHFYKNSQTAYGFFNCTSRTVDLAANGPKCAFCEAENKRCKLKSNSTSQEIECYEHLRTSRGARKTPLITGLVLVSLLLVIVVLLLSYKYRKDKADRENRVKIEKFLEDYRALKPTRYSYADIKRITNDFNDKLGEGGYGAVFKGKLSHEIVVAVKILNNSKGNGEEFINEVGTIGRFITRALVYEFLPNESLEKFKFATNGNKHVLCWEKLLDIALGAAKGIQNLHQGCEQRVLHFDIKPNNILLDHNFNPKISDFGLAKLGSKDQSAVLMTTARGTMGYIAPEVFTRNFGNVPYKSDVYSFGMLLLEMVAGRKNIDVNVENTSQFYFPEWIYNHLEQGEELRICIGEEGEAEIAKKLAIVAASRPGFFSIKGCKLVISSSILMRIKENVNRKAATF